MRRRRKVSFLPRRRKLSELRQPPLHQLSAVSRSAKPALEANAWSSNFKAGNLVPDNGTQNMLIEFDDQVRPSEDMKRSIIGKFTAMEGSDNVTLETKNDSQSSHTRMLMETQLLSNHEQTDLSCTGRLSEDGYNWRKYGQKHVKGAECPRSYYRCAYPGCVVKKKVEHSHDGQISEVSYRYRHNHPKPQPTNRSAFGSLYSFNEMPDAMARLGSYTSTYEEPIGTSFTAGFEDQIGIDRCDGGMERTTPTSIVMKVSQPVSISNAKHTELVEFTEDRDYLPPVTGRNYDEDGATQGSMSLDDEGEDDETEPKRRKKDSVLIETSLACHAVREPRVVIQTESEVDLLDDGYRWRKYGQKEVKGNPYPRSYYRCTNPGCVVRKQIERASNDLRLVITTYEGKHNHKVSAARTNNQINSCGSTLHACYPLKSSLNLASHLSNLFT